MANKVKFNFAAQRAAFRAEIFATGFHPDNFLSTTPDLPVCGLNLACAFPFPVELEKPYACFAEKISELDPGIYVYPFSTTHITILTFVNFASFQEPSAERVRETNALANQLATLLAPIFSDGAFKNFELRFSRPIITRKAGIFFLADPNGEITRIRQTVAALLAENKTLSVQLNATGLNIPTIVHSTFLRFRTAPQQVEPFLVAFDGISANANLGTIQINELLLTSETKPYMRGGEILHRFPLNNFA